MDYTAVPVGVEETKPCIYLGIILISDPDCPLAVLIRAGADYRPNTQLTVEVMAGSADDAAAFHRAMKRLMVDLKEQAGRDVWHPLERRSSNQAAS